MFAILSSISGLGHFIVAAFCLIAFVALYSSWKKTRNEMVKNFVLMFVFVAIFMFVMGTMDYLIALKEDLVAQKSPIPGFMFAVAHIFMVLAISLYARIPFRALIPRRKNLGFWLAFGTGLIPIVVAFANVIFPTVEAKITHYNVGTLFSACIGIWALIFIAGFGGIFFLYQTFKTTERFVRIRSAVLGIGFLMWMIGGPLHDFAKTTAVYLLADLLLLLSFIVILSGIYVKEVIAK